jgi:hypothetical protein
MFSVVFMCVYVIFDVCVNYVEPEIEAARARLFPRAQVICRSVLGGRDSE